MKTKIYLYGALDANVAESYKAKEAMDASGVEYTHLFYSDEAQLPHVLTPINTWFKDRKISGFPFVTWTEEDGTVDFAEGLKAIKAVNFKKDAPADPQA